MTLFIRLKTYFSPLEASSNYDFSPYKQVPTAIFPQNAQRSDGFISFIFMGGIAAILIFLVVKKCDGDVTQNNEVDKAL